MRVIEPSYEIPELNGLEMVRKLEAYGRTCYRSEGRATEDSWEPFLRDKLKRGHLSLIEHEKVTVSLVCDRGVTHELVRHRLASYSQESTRYCDYSGEVIFIRPFILVPGSTAYISWEGDMKQVERWYKLMRDEELTPEWARCILPNCLKTEIVVTCNLREWLHIFKLRCDKSAHPQMRQLMVPLLRAFDRAIPLLFAHFEFHGPEFPDPDGGWGPEHLGCYATTPFYF